MSLEEKKIAAMGLILLALALLNLWAKRRLDKTIAEIKEESKK